MDYKHARIELGLDWRQAGIEKGLDWRKAGVWQRVHGIGDRLAKSWIGEQAKIQLKIGLGNKLQKSKKLDWGLRME